MTSRSDLEVYRQAVAALSVKAQGDANGFLTRLDTSDPIAARDALLETVPDLIDVYADAAAQLGGDYYANLREDSGASSDFTPTYVTPDDDAVLASARWAAGGLFDPTRSLDGAVGEVLDRHIKAGARDTVMQSSIDDPLHVRYARIPTGSVTCKFCAMLASRGAVYASDQSAGKFKRWHGHCDCQVHPVFPGEELPAGYDPDHYLDIYKQSGGANITTRKVRRQDGTVNREVDLNREDRVPTADQVKPDDGQGVPAGEGAADEGRDAVDWRSKVADSTTAAELFESMSGVLPDVPFSGDVPDLEKARKLLSALGDLTERYPVRNLDSVKFKPLGDDAGLAGVAHWEGLTDARLIFNTDKEWDQDSLTQSSKSGWWHVDPAVGVDRYITTHEYGHVLDCATNREASTQALEIVRAAVLAETGDELDSPSAVLLRGHQLGMISRYGRTNTHELVAEAFATVETSPHLATNVERMIHQLVTTLPRYEAS